LLRYRERVIDLNNSVAFGSRALQLAGGLHISDHRLATFIHMHMFDADSLRVAVPQAA
jgi:hypothetical protein